MFRVLKEKTYDMFVHVNIDRVEIACKFTWRLRLEHLFEIDAAIFQNGCQSQKLTRI